MDPNQQFPNTNPNTPPFNQQFANANPNQPPFNQQFPNTPQQQQYPPPFNQQYQYPPQQPQFPPQQYQYPNPNAYGFASFARAPPPPSADSFLNLLVQGLYGAPLPTPPGQETVQETVPTQTSHGQPATPDPQSQSTQETVVPETQQDFQDDFGFDLQPGLQAIERRRKSKKRQIPLEGEAPATGKAQKWSPAQVLCLTQCYLEISEDPLVGNAQPADFFWKRILDKFHERMGRGVFRNRDQLTSKWRETNTRISRWVGIHSSMARGSGVGDGDFMDACRRRYATEMGHPFALEDCWNLCKQSPKWAPVASSSSQSSGSKRRREAGGSTTEDSVDSRPIGRHAAREAARGRGSARGGGSARAAGSSSTPAEDESGEFLEVQRTKIEVERLKLEQLSMLTAEKRSKREMRMQLEALSADKAIMKMDHNDYEGEERKQVKAMKLEAATRLREARAQGWNV